MVKDSDHLSRYFPSNKLFEKSVCVKNFSHQNFALYSIDIMGYNLAIVSFCAPKEMVSRHTRLDTTCTVHGCVCQLMTFGCTTSLVKGTVILLIGC